MTDYAESGVRLVAEIDSYRESMNEALDLASQFDSLGELSVSLNVDTSSAEGEISTLDDVDVTVTPNLDDTNILPFEDLANETVEPEVAPQITTEGQTTLSRIHDLVDIAAHGVNLVVNVAGMGLDALQSVAGPLVEIDTGLAQIKATTGETIPGARELITKIFGEDLGTGVDQITQAVIHAQQLHAPIEEATTAALNFTKVFSDQNPNQVMDTMDTMVKNHLAPDFKTAGDLLTVAFQNGANKGGDLLTAIQGNAGAIKDLGLTGPGFLQMVTNELANGASSATTVVQGLENIKRNIQSQTTSGSGAALDVLKQLNIPNPITSGKGWTDDFFTSVADAIASAPVDDAKKQQMFAALAGGKIGQKDYEAFLHLDDGQKVFTNVSGAAATAATDIDNSLSGAVSDFERAAQTAATNFLSSDQIDLPGKMNALKGGLQDALNVLAQGGDLGQALTVALKPIGFDDEFQSLESSLGNFVIGILQAVQSIQSALGQTEAAKGTQNTITGLAKTQLAFDLKINNPDELGTSVETAFSRGLQSSDVQAAIGTAVTQLVGQGSTAQAQAILDNLKNGQVILTGITSAITGQSMPDVKIPVNPEFTPEQQAAFVKQTEDSFTAQGFNFTAQVTPQIPQDKIDDLQKQINSAKSAAYDPLSSITTTTTPSDNVTRLATSTETMALNSKQAADVMDTLNTAQDAQNLNTQDLTANVALQNVATSDLGTSFAAAINAYQTANGQIKTNTSNTKDATNATAGLSSTVQDVKKHIDQANLSFMSLITTAQTFVDNAHAWSSPQFGAGADVNTGSGNPGATPGKKRASGGEASGTFMVGEEGREIVSTNPNVAVLNNKTTEAIMAAVSGTAGRGGVTNYGGSRVVNLTQNNIVANEAVADVLGYKTSETIRGMA